jgi:hypothetical protein
MRTRPAGLAALFGLLLATGSPAAEANASACSAGCAQYVSSSAFSGTSVSATLVGVTAGHSIHVFWCLTPNTLTVTGVTIGGNAATVGTNTSGTGGSDRCGMAVYPNSPSGSVSVVVNASATCSGCYVHAEEWAGDAATSPLDGQNSTYTADGIAGTSLPSGVFTSTATDTIEAMIFEPNGASNTIPSGFTTAANDTANGWISSYKTSVTAGAQNPTFTSVSGAFDNFVSGAAFKSASGVISHLRLLIGAGK